MWRVMEVFILVAFIITRILYLKLQLLYKLECERHKNACKTRMALLQESRELQWRQIDWLQLEEKYTFPLHEIVDGFVKTKV